MTNVNQDLTNVITLLPCPFCGGEAVLDKVDEGADYRPWFWYTVHCSNRDCVCADLCHEYETEAEAIAAWNARATGGTLTAEQVMAIAGKHQPDYCSDTHVCFEWRAIADELNATLGGGEGESSKERLQKMLDEMKKLARDGRREWCGRSHGEFGIFVTLGDFAEAIERRIDWPWMWR